MRTQEYAPGRPVDLYGDPIDRTVLLWHGTQTDARATVRTLAGMLVDRGLSVVVPDWDSHSTDNGRSDLLASADFARQWSRAETGLGVIGWSLGGVAAAGLAARAADIGLELAFTVCLAGAFMVRDPIFGLDVGDALTGAGRRPPFTLLHGSADDVVAPAVSRAFAAQLRAHDWPVRLVELAADHGNIAGARYDSAHDRYAPADDEATRSVTAEVADHIASAARES